MPNVKCSYPHCKKPEKISRSPAKLKESKLHFHDNECRLAFQHEYGFYGKKPNHELNRKLKNEWTVEYQKHHPPSPFRKLMTRQ